MFSNYETTINNLIESGILQTFRACDDKKLTGRIILIVEYNQGGIRSVNVTQKKKLK